MNLRDVAYVDQERLDQYAEQLLGPSKFEKLQELVVVDRRQLRIPFSFAPHRRAPTFAQPEKGQWIGMRELKTVTDWFRAPRASNCAQ